MPTRPCARKPARRTGTAARWSARALEAARACSRIAPSPPHHGRRPAALARAVAAYYLG